MQVFSSISSLGSQEELEVERVMQYFLKGLQCQEVPAVMDFYIDESMVMFEVGSMLIGKQQIRSYYRGLSTLKPEFSFGQPKIWVQGDIALYMIDWSMKRSANQKESGLRCIVLKRHGSTWKIAIEHPYSHLEWPPNRLLSA